MSRDYAKKPSTSRAATSRPPSRKKPAAPAKKKVNRQSPSRQSGGLSIRWILSLALVGGFVGFIAYLNSMPKPDASQPVATKAPAKSATANSKSEQAPADKPAKQKQAFQFYEMLPESEVVAPKVEAYDPGPTAAQRKYRYVIQTGSFRGREDAERQRAQIAFQGLQAKIDEINLESGSVWYRVNIGPYDSRSKMNSAVDKLVRINIAPLVRKVPKEG
ncbi:SPOR domain-containing protein [Marinobacter sp. BGYM27]|uniref:SPOR domain-containing protein n=1 Tax=unclassified Marinobacter TaxID=83889 RepID=UPI0021A7EEB4|nr:SPOR domain-containing protein [Marinobacter sp. BGYM27]MDG5501360.1 SPOR domain-containing protein [Marinobacter sp. BGYM27]